MPRVCAVLFDLDGTFADTAPDLLAAVNWVRHERATAPLPIAHLIPWITLGTNAIVREAIGVPEDDPAFARMRARFLDLYERHLGERARTHEGIDEVLAALDQRSVSWGIVTNKPARFAEPLVARLTRERPVCVVSGDTLARAKPYPDPLLHGCRLAKCRPRECAYVGDAATDVEAAHRAGMAALVALFGYLGADARPELWGAEALIAHPLDLLVWLDGSAPRRPVQAPR